MESLSISEKDYADRTGIPRPVLKTFREESLQPGTHWELDERKVVILEAGLDRLNRRFSVDPKNFEKKPAAGKKAAPSVLKALRSPTNRRIVLAIPLNADDCKREFKGPQRHHPITAGEQRAAICRVRVRDNKKFLPGMEIPVTHIQADYYELKGPQPRYRGRF